MYPHAHSLPVTRAYPPLIHTQFSKTQKCTNPSHKRHTQLHHLWVMAVNISHTHTHTHLHTQGSLPCPSWLPIPLSTLVLGGGAGGWNLWRKGTEV